MTESWSLKGEMALSCSCTVFCPCVLSLGEHPPTEDRCQTWAGIRIDDGHFDTVDLSGIKVGPDDGSARHHVARKLDRGAFYR